MEFEEFEIYEVNAILLVCSGAQTFRLHHYFIIFCPPIISRSCLHIEVASLGIDVVAVHPSPVASNFYSNLDLKVDMIEAAAKNAVPPSDLPDDIFRSIGGAALRDLGSLAWCTRMGTFFLPYNFFARVFAIAAPHMPDWKVHNKNR